MDEKLCWPCDEPVIEQLPACPLQCKSPKCPSYKKKTQLPDLSQKVVIWVMGGPGSGKATQCANIVKQYGFTHLSIGAILREEVKKGSVRSQCLTNIMERGELVPNDHVMDLLKEAMLATAAGTSGFVIYGFPREERQGVMFEKNIAPVTLVLYIEVSDATLTQRLKAKAATAGRVADNSDAIRIRLRTFHEHNRLLIDQYPHRLVKINGERPVDAIFVDVQRAIDDAIAVHHKRLEQKEKEKGKEEEIVKPVQATPPKINQPVPSTTPPIEQVKTKT